jgi:hypothetical protein
VVLDKITVKVLTERHLLGMVSAQQAAVVAAVLAVLE